MNFKINNKIKLITFSILLVGFSVTGCKKFVEIAPPTTQLVTASVFSDNNTVTAAQLVIYTNMSNSAESYKMALSCGLLSDELTNYSTSATQIQYYNNAMQASSAPGPWNAAGAYNYIYQANAIIGGLQNNASINTAVATQLRSESKFIRAFWYFYLTNLYGDVPLALTTNYTINNSLSRSPQALVYQQMVADLKDAQTGLNSNYVDVSDTLSTTERIRPNKGAATALLARVYLYTQKYDSAEAQATAVINNGLYSLCSSLSGTSSVFLKNSTEAIWQLQTSLPSNSATNDGLQFILISAPLNVAISPQLIAGFETGDKRKSSWIGGYPTATPLYNFPYKYQTGNLGSTATSLGSIPEYTMVLRLAEQFLIRAEARAQQGNTTGALADLNTIRRRSGLLDYAGATDKASLLSAVLHERQVELFTEWGHRWLDLKRTGNLDAVMGGPTGVCRAKGGIWASTAQLFPIPSNELLNDANMVQNPGY